MSETTRISFAVVSFLINFYAEHLGFVSMKKLNLERLTVRLGLTATYFSRFRQALPDFLKVCIKMFYNEKELYILTFY